MNCSPAWGGRGLSSSQRTLANSHGVVSARAKTKQGVRAERGRQWPGLLFWSGQWWSRKAFGEMKSDHREWRRKSELLERGGARAKCKVCILMMTLLLSHFTGEEMEAQRG